MLPFPRKETVNKMSFEWKVILAGCGVIALFSLASISPNQQNATAQPTAEQKNADDKESTRVAVASQVARKHSNKTYANPKA